MYGEEGNVGNIHEIYESFYRKLMTNNEFVTVTKKFLELNTNADRVSFTDDLLKKYGLIPKLIRRDKDDVLSTKYRHEGNEAFNRKENLAACLFYTKSIAYAKSDSDCLGLAYANRSAVLYEKKMYKECLEDITNAFKSNYPKKLYPKLIKRENRARQFLPSQIFVKYYEKIDSVVNPSNKIQCADAGVEIRNSEVSGRGVVALRNFKLGDVISVEKPYAQLLRKEHLRDHCYFCLELCYNMIPCDGCVYAMFCTQKCQQNAWSQSHCYECPILHTLYALEITRVALLTLRIVIQAKEHYPEIKDYKPETNDVYKSQHYEEVYFSATNMHMGKTSDLLKAAITAAVLRNILIEGSQFHQNLDDPERDKTIFDELIMRHLLTGELKFHSISEYVQGIRGYVTTVNTGAGVYAFSCLVNHSCVPNVVCDNHSSEMILRAIMPISKGDEILSSYGCHYANIRKDERQRQLQEQYLFECHCEACEGNWPLYLNLPERGMLFCIPQHQSLLEGDRDKAIKVLTYLLTTYGKIADKYFHCPTMFIVDLQETIKQCYALLGNRKPKF